jgi:AraC-like DNA-binding protein/quercetin dioxygenase-like cupin family protein
MERLTTAALPMTKRMAAWNDLYSTRMSRVEFAPIDTHQQFDAELNIGHIGPVTLAKLSVDQCTIERTRRHLRHSPRLYSFLLQVKGSSVFHHYGREAKLSEGDFVLCDTGMPHYFHTGGPSLTLMVRVTPEVMSEYLPASEQFCGLHLSHAVGVTSTVSAMAQSLVDKIDFGRCPDYEARVARHLLEMISISYAMAFNNQTSTSTAIWRRRTDVIRYIEDHLREPSLTVESIADGVRLSARYLRAIFSDSGEKASAYIRRRRLEDCARKMRDPAWGGHTLTEIAFSSGFNSAAHFTRCFRNQFNMSPREYRRGATADVRT